MTASATSSDRSGDAVPVWTVGTVARRLGLAPSTLRSWGLRHGIGPEGHLPGQHRRYSDEDVAELAAMCRLVEQGVVLVTAAAIAHDEREEKTRHVETAAGSRSTIDQAIGILMGQTRLGADHAFDALRVRSQTSNTRLRDVAAQIIAEHTDPAP